jgi:hypothetical protein
MKRRASLVWDTQQLRNREIVKYLLRMDIAESPRHCTMVMSVLKANPELVIP